MADPLSGVVEGRDSQPGHMVTDALMELGRRDRRGRDEVIDHDHGPLGIEHFVEATVAQQDDDAQRVLVQDGPT